MSPVSYEAASTQSCYETMMLLRDVSADAASSVIVDLASAREFSKIVLSYQARGIRLALGAATVLFEEDLSTMFARLGFDYSAHNDFSNETAIRLAKSGIHVDESSLEDVDLPPV